MENKKKTIFNVIFLLVVFTGTMYGVFHGEDIGEIVKILEQVNVLWLIPGVICVVVFIWGESIIIYYMMRTLKIRLKSGRNSREKRMLSGAPNHIHGNRTSACGCLKTIFRL